MGKIERLIANYEQFARLPWERSISGPQRVWFAIYDPPDERRLRRRLQEFELATNRAEHTWALCDLTDAFAEWMATQEYRDSYFESPDDLDPALGEFHEYVTGELAPVLRQADVDDNTVVGVLGVGGLFGAMRVSHLMDAVAAEIRGRLLVFFPGSQEGTLYRLLDARDGWNYRAVPITA